MNTNTLKTLSLAGALLVSSSAIADYNYGDQGALNERTDSWYIHGAVGRAFGHGSESDFTDRFADEGIDARIISSDNDRYGWRLGFGYQWNKYLGYEVGYIDLEEEEVRIGADTDNYELARASVADISPEYDDGVGVAIVGTYPFNKYWRAIGKIGMQKWYGEGDIDNENNVFYGIGVDRYFNKYINIRAEIQRHEMLRDDMEFLSIGLEYFFQGRTKPEKKMLPFTPKPKAVPKPEPVAAIIPAPVVVDNDLDKDGVLNNADQCPDTPAGKKVNEVGCEILKEITLLIDFDTASDVVKSDYMPEIEKVVEYLNSNEGLQAVVEGHTDNVGKDAYNQALSERRANSLMNIMIDRYNVASERLNAVGYGESKPAADNSTAAGRKANRRVVVTISKPSSDR